MSKSLFFLSLFAFLVFSCSENKQDNSEPDSRSQSERIIDSAIAFHGGVKYWNSEISFGFRDKIYFVNRTANRFSYSVVFSDSLGNHKRQLTNEGFTEEINNKRTALSSKDSSAYAGALNSVVYFAMLPSLLNDDAVQSVFDGEEEIKSKMYYRIKVTFSKEGGGEDHDDVYLYWFDKADYSMDYLAYSFHVNDGGSRFRAVTKSRRVNGIIFQDYENFKGPSADSLRYISDLYKADRMPVLSHIELNRISVNAAPTSISEVRKTDDI